MPRLSSKTCLQALVAVLALVPVTVCTEGVLTGSSFLTGAPSRSVDLDSHFRYLSGIFLAVGLLFYATVPAIERKTALFRLAASLVVAGGLGRLVSLLVAGTPTAPHVAGLVLELLVVPSLVVWQASVARRTPAFGWRRTRYPGA